MQRNSVIYILGFCVAVCLVCAVIVSSSAVGLKDKQDLNKVLDRQKKVLSVAGIDFKDTASSDEIQSLFSKRIKLVVVDLKTGKVDQAATKDAASFDQQKAKKDPAQSADAPKNLAGVRRVPNKAMVYQVSQKEMGTGGAGFQLEQYIFPIEGKGLWSTLYGYLALESDGNSIKGITFYQHGETPGLGGEVDNPAWKAKWPGRKLFGPQGSSVSSWGEAKITVKKGQAGTPEQDPYQVDGLSGATITGNGVTHLVRFWMGDNGFGKYIRNVVGQAS
ncbi:MAG: Na(+)-translocating NADH-quinone reductase subunit C [Myxococcota bacterium]|nr:Na(+)-translocating NADH-quinone reductase subunit C [Myxococcota bacterium]